MGIIASLAFINAPGPSINGEISIAMFDFRIAY
jgi:hypothetical protein